MSAPRSPTGKMFTRPIVASSLKATAAPAAAGHGRELVRVAIGVVAWLAVVWLVLEWLGA